MERWAIVYRGTRPGYSASVTVWYWTGKYWSTDPEFAKQYKRAPYSLPDPREQDPHPKYDRILLDTEYGRPQFYNARWYGSGDLVAQMEVLG